MVIALFGAAALCKTAIFRWSEFRKIHSAQYTNIYIWRNYFAFVQPIIYSDNKSIQPEVPIK